MNGFHDVSFPAKLALGASGGPERRTEIVTLASGKEVRNANWAQSRRRWDVGAAVTDLASLQTLLNFFEAREGRLFGFRFRDPMDHSSHLPGQEVSAVDQVIGVGDESQTVFQLTKTYGAVQRVISKPVLGSVVVALDDVEQSNGWSVNTVTGELVFDVAPVSGSIVTAGFLYDCPVRFTEDRIEGVVEAFGAGRVVSVGLTELI